ncbi:hypothetical protein MYCO108962_12650 [Mycobacterium colombiense]
MVRDGLQKSHWSSAGAPHVYSKNRVNGCARISLHTDSLLESCAVRGRSNAHFVPPLHLDPPDGRLPIAQRSQEGDWGWFAGAIPSSVAVRLTGPLLAKRRRVHNGLHWRLYAPSPNPARGCRSGSGAFPGDCSQGEGVHQQPPSPRWRPYRALAGISSSCGVTRIRRVASLVVSAPGKRYRHAHRAVAPAVVTGLRARLPRPAEDIAGGNDVVFRPALPRVRCAAGRAPPDRPIIRLVEIARGDRRRVIAASSGVGSHFGFGWVLFA